MYFTYFTKKTVKTDLTPLPLITVYQIDISIQLQVGQSRCTIILISCHWYCCHCKKKKNNGATSWNRCDLKI